ncbi:hypothetical protein PQ465_09220 [Sphingobacterium oryzagri]|uniref:Lipoprotein n=1 Tax=Sphingobacterium oryzagri TaxID=3025669 RepID=A0ABY7WMX0_9SPHI|nr:hypothetical protein [Sphingobacterium sp. KACC 22765]WDF70538.1 hypothetical protein PQ465_09220 [Sphingobacterium sp. KACC 22765]
MKLCLITLLTGLILSLSGCSLYGPVYLGEKYPPTNTVQTFYSTKDIKQPFQVIGHMNASTSPTASGQARTKRSIVAKAKTIGADAVVFSQLDRQSNDKTTDDFSIKVEVIKFD